MANINIGIQVSNNGAIQGLNQVSQAINGVASSSNQATKATNNASKATQNAGKSAKSASSNFKSMGDVLGRLSPQLGGITNGVSGFVDSLKNAKLGVVGFGTAMVAAIGVGAGVVTMKLAEMADKLQDNADMLGISVKDYQTMNAMLISVGSSMDKFGNSFATFTDKVVNGDKIFKKYGVSITDANGYLKDSLDVQDEFLLRVSKMKTEQEKLAALTGAYGKGGRKFLGIVGSPEELKAAQEKAKAMAVPEEVLKSYTAIGDVLDDIRGFAFKNLAITFKPMTDSLKELINVAKESSIIKDAFKGFTRFVATTGAGLAKVFTMVLAGWNVLYDSIVIGLNWIIKEYNNLAKETNAWITRQAQKIKDFNPMGKDASKNLDVYISKLAEVDSALVKSKDVELDLYNQRNIAQKELNDAKNDNIVRSDKELKRLKKNLNLAEKAWLDYGTKISKEGLATTDYGTGTEVSDYTKTTISNLKQNTGTLNHAREELLKLIEQGQKYNEKVGLINILPALNLDFSDQADAAKAKLEKEKASLEKMVTPEWWAEIFKVPDGIVSDEPRPTGDKPIKEVTDLYGPLIDRAREYNRIAFGQDLTPLQKTLSDYKAEYESMLRDINEADEQARKEGTYSFIKSAEARALIEEGYNKKRLEATFKAEKERADFVKSITDELVKSQLASKEWSLDAMIQLNEMAYQEELSVLNENIIQKGLMEDEAMQLREAKEKEHLESLSELNKNYAWKQFDTWSSYATQTWSKISSIGASISQSKQKEVDEWFDTEKEKLDAVVMTNKRRVSEEKKLESEKESRMREQKNKEKAWNISEAIMSGAVGIANIWKQWAAYPVVAAALSVVEAGIIGAQIGVIGSQQFADGGVIGGFGGASVGKDNRVATVRDGEMVLNGNQQKTLFNSIQSGNLGSKNINITQGNITIQGSASQSAIDQIKVEQQKFSILIRDTINDLRYRRQLSFS